VRRLAALLVAAALAGIVFVVVRDLARGYRSTRGAKVERFTLRSHLVGRELHEVLVVPGGGSRRPLLVFLHGRSSPPDGAPGVFDDAADFGRHDLLRLARSQPVFTAPAWIEVGRADPFQSANAQLARELRARGVSVTFHLVPGGQSGWRDRMPTYLRWYATRLSRCRSGRSATR
jgi:enterochelin esterase-like enzyme